MLLYHGSKQKFEKLERRQASSPYVDVPEGEKLEAIYLTSDYGFAVAHAARPDGVTRIDNENKTIEFEHPEKFDPQIDIYIYTIDGDKIPPEHLKKENELQYAVTELSELEPSFVENKKAEEILKYYKLLNWEKKENTKEISNENKFKIR